MSVIQVYLLYYSKVYSSDGLLWKKGFVIIPHEDQVIQSIWIFLIYNEFWLMKLSFRNQIPFTPTQIEAIRSGMQPGLTMVVGPPGTGKTDVAVQIISNIYHNFPDQRTLIVTHSNQVKYTHTLCSLIFLDVSASVVHNGFISQRFLIVRLLIVDQQLWCLTSDQKCNGWNHLLWKLSQLFFFVKQALNQLFEKIMALDIDERHLLRLGHGEEALETEKDFSR